MGDNGRRTVLNECLWCNTQTRNKKYCSNRHQRDHEYDQNVTQWLAGDISGTTVGGGASAYVRRYLIESLGEKCQKCGWNERNPVTDKVPVQLEHIDGDWTNNRPENLTLLCPNHHSLTETYGALNGPVSRKNRGLEVREGRVRSYRAKYGQ